jgi:hypothetical protein
VTARNDYAPGVQSKIEAHRRFWEGTGPSLIFIPRGDVQLYDMKGYVERFENPRLMFDFEAGRASGVQDWPTDGIPAVRPSLGTVFVPAVAGQEYLVNPGEMPWPGRRLTREEIRAVSVTDVASTPMYRRAREFYGFARERRDVVGYHADTQGVFDIAHLLYGTDIFLDIATPESQDWVRELLRICLSLYLAVSDELKRDLGEARGEMIHGHGTPQGLYFPTAGVRISEDSATLVSPGMVDAFLASVIEASMEPFGGGFVHYCGRHEHLFESLCRSSLVRAIDLGNAEAYDLDFLASVAARTGTVLHTRLPGLEGEGWEAYLRRIGAAMKKHGARCVLRPLVYPSSREECGAMLDLWHRLTS